VAYQHIEPVSKQVTIVIGLTVVGFMAFGLALSFYRNVLFEQTLENIRKQNDILMATIDEGKRELEYFRSSQYKDKYAKENLGKINPGEKVLIVTRKPTDNLTDTEPLSTPKSSWTSPDSFMSFINSLSVWSTLDWHAHFIFRFLFLNSWQYSFTHLELSVKVSSQ